MGWLNKVQINSVHGKHAPREEFDGYQSLAGPVKHIRLPLPPHTEAHNNRALDRMNTTLPKGGPQMPPQCNDVIPYRACAVCGDIQHTRQILNTGVGLRCRCDLAMRFEMGRFDRMTPRGMTFFRVGKAEIPADRYEHPVLANQRASHLGTHLRARVNDTGEYSVLVHSI